MLKHLLIIGLYNLQINIAYCIDNEFNNNNFGDPNFINWHIVYYFWVLADTALLCARQNKVHKKIISVFIVLYFILHCLLHSHKPAEHKRSWAMWLFWQQFNNFFNENYEKLVCTWNLKYHKLFNIETWQWQKWKTNCQNALLPFFMLNILILYLKSLIFFINLINVGMFLIWNF